FYQRINKAVQDASHEDERLAGMAGRFTFLDIARGDLFFAHVGHTKAFLFRDGALIHLTTDHTLRQEELDLPGPKPLAGSKLDGGHVVTESLGSRVGGTNVEIEHIQLWSNDRILLCTNGLTDVVADDRIAGGLALRRPPNDHSPRLGH